MATVFLLGAGASAFSADCRPSTPPIGECLFDELVRRGGVAATIDLQLAALFKVSFEDGMAEFRATREADIATFLREMADYFADFVPGPANLYHQLLATVSDLKRRAIYATLNYDILIECAVTLAGLEVSYVLPAPANNVAILKLHGSCNFLPDMRGVTIRGISFDVRGGGPNSSILEDDVRIARSAAEIHDFCRSEDSLAPAIAVYGRGKPVLFCPSFVQYQQKQWRAAVAASSRVVIIGVGVNPADDHVWQPLAKSRCPLFYVGPDAKPFFAWASNVRRRHVTHFADSFASAIPAIHRMLRS